VIHLVMRRRDGALEMLRRLFDNRTNDWLPPNQV
jgi:hypothetical protein